MIAAFDVCYCKDGTAQVAAVVFKGFSDETPYARYIKMLEKMEDYVPGSFYKRELPCIISLYSDIREEIDTIVLDGYVFLGERPGLGALLAKELGPHLVIVGVAKTFFEGSRPVEVFRGKSHKPLYVTASGLEPGVAAQHILSMHGKHRMPELLKEVDRLSKLKQSGIHS